MRCLDMAVLNTEMSLFTYVFCVYMYLTKGSFCLVMYLSMFVHDVLCVEVSSLHISSLALIVVAFKYLRIFKHDARDHINPEVLKK